MVLKIEQTLKPEAKQKFKLINRVKLANLVKSPEDIFARFVKEIEDDHLFKKLAYPEDRNQKVINYKRFFRADLTKNFYELKEEISMDKTSFDVESFLDSRKDFLPVIKKLGIDKFKQYFLYNEQAMSYKEIASVCGLQTSEVKRIIDFINEISIHSEFYYPSTISPETSVRYSKVASIEKDNHGNFIVTYFSPNYARGRYSVNHERLKQLRKDNVFSEQEMKRVNKLIENLEIINQKKAIIHNVIQNIIEIQSHYLNSGDWSDLKPFTQKELAVVMGVNPSLICRAISNRSIETPRGEEKPLKYFFPNKKGIRKYLIKEVITNENHSYTDEEIKQKLRVKYGINISRCSVSICRRELNILSSKNRCVIAN